MAAPAESIPQELLGFSPVVSKLIGRGEREKDDKCREELVDCLFLLSATSEGRDAMRDAHVVCTTGLSVTALTTYLVRSRPYYGFGR